MEPRLHPRITEELLKGSEQSLCQLRSLWLETGSAEQSLGAERARRRPGAGQLGEGGGWDWSRGARDRALRDVSNRKQTDHGDRGAAGVGEGPGQQQIPREQDQRAARTPRRGSEPISCPCESVCRGRTWRTCKLVTEGPAMCSGRSRGTGVRSALLALRQGPVAPCVGLGPARRKAPEDTGGPRASPRGSDRQTKKADSQQLPKRAAPGPPSDRPVCAAAPGGCQESNCVLRMH